MFNSQSLFNSHTVKFQPASACTFASHPRSGSAATLRFSKKHPATMNDTEVNLQIQQMVRFIKQEAEEKAAEIMVSAEEEFNITKLQLLEADKAKLRREYERRQATIEVRKKVDYSKQLNESRLKVLQAREDAVQTLLRGANAQLAKLSADQAAYGRLLQELLLQAMHKLGEPRVLVRCRQVDAALVRSLLPQVGPIYAKLYGGEAPTAEVDEAHPLSPPPKGDAPSGDEFDTCAGGVVVTSANGKIVCSNTLDDRLKITYGQNLPTIRSLLFGAAA